MAKDKIRVREWKYMDDCWDGPHIVSKYNAGNEQTCLESAVAEHNALVRAYRELLKEARE